MTTDQKTESKGDLNKQFLDSIESKKRAVIIASMVVYYGCSSEDAIKEVTSNEAEDLFEYLVEPVRSTVYEMMKSHAAA